MAKLTPFIAVGLTSFVAAGCFGAGEFEVADAEPGDALPVAPAANGSAGVPGPAQVALSVQKDQVLLIPFQIRLEKVAHVLGVDGEHPALNDLKAHRFELGDHDFANGIIPDRSWNASRFALWVKSLRAVCASTEFKARYPSLPAGLDALIVDAYGRHATAEDALALQETLDGLSLSSSAAHLTTCLSVLSATEFVSR